MTEKLMIASDLHGSAYYCERMLAAYDREKADKLLFLGDILYHGPRNDLPIEYNPKKVTAMLNQRKQDLLCVKGNCDSEVDQMVLEFPIMAEYCILYLGQRMIFATHGHVFNEENLPMLKKGDVLLHGHTHLPTIKELENCTYLNPGSLSLPKENNISTYIILENEMFSWKDLNGNEVKRYKFT